MNEKFVVTIYVNVNTNADVNLKQAAYAAADRLANYNSALSVVDVTVDEVTE